MKVSDISVELIGSFGDDMTVANAARVSFHKEAQHYTPEQNEKLIRYLAGHKHFSPFNHAFLSFRVKAPIFVARQLVKHKFLPWNEVSRRYVDDEPEFYFPAHWRAKAENVKQGSSDEAVPLDPSVFAIHGMLEAVKTYNKLLEQGVCPEQARMVLPQNTMTEWVWSGTLGAWLDMLVLRLDPHTQKETRDVATKIGIEVARNFPISFGARLNV